MGREEKAEQEVVIGLFRPADAPGVSRLFRTVYGEGYPVKYYYDPVLLNEAVTKRDTLLMVGRTPSDEVVGAVALFRSAPNPLLYELGSGLVHPQYRSLGIINRLIEFALGGEGVRRENPMDGFWGESVCNHVYMQKTSQHWGVAETAIEVDLMPAAAYEKEKSAAGRVASVACFGIWSPQPHTIYMPASYEEGLRFVYQDLDDPRVFRLAEETPPAEGSRTTLGEQVFDFADMARIAVNSLGEDFPSVFSALEARLRAQGIHLVQVWLKLSTPGVGWATEQLRGKGYFCCGALPRWFEEGDALLMSKTFARPCWEGIHLYSDKAKRLLETIRADWERAERAC